MEIEKYILFAMWGNYSLTAEKLEEELATTVTAPAVMDKAPYDDIR